MQDMNHMESSMTSPGPRHERDDESKNRRVSTGKRMKFQPQHARGLTYEFGMRIHCESHEEEKLSHRMCADSLSQSMPPARTEIAALGV